MPPSGADPETIKAALRPFALTPVSAEALGAYHDECYSVDTEQGRYVLKIAPAGTPDEIIDLETKVVAHALEKLPDLPIPEYVLTGDRRRWTTVRIAGRDRIARLLPFAEGVHYAAFQPHTPSLRLALGSVLGRLDRSLLDLAHRAMNRYFEWDLAQAADAAAATSAFSDPARRKMIDEIFSYRHRHVEPVLPGLRRSIIHADANDYNVLVTTDDAGSPAISALLDFGDTLLTHTVNEVAVACAYVMLGQPDPVSAAQDLIRGYVGELPLQEDEVSVLYPLIRTRLAMSATFSARWRRENPGHDGDDAYHTVSEQAVWDLLERLKDIHPAYAHYAFREASGLEPVPHGSTIAAYLRSIATAPLLPDGLRTVATCVIDLSVGSTDPAASSTATDPTRWSEMVREQIEAAGAQVGIGRYNEPRTCYTSSQFTTPGGEPRTVHLGLDLFAAAGTPIRAPIDGTVHSLLDNDVELDYGPTVILGHEAPGAPPFFTLYGHLDRETLRKLSPGLSIAAGQEFARLGDEHENGGWPPHVHFQIITDLLGHEGNFPGVARPGDRTLWTAISPDPNLLLRIPGVEPPAPMECDSIAKLRRRYTGPNLKLSYRQPLHIVRGRGQYLYDFEGRRYLDGVNNVAHVGHSHPRVAAAIGRQAAVLNTNTRYLHENLVRYAERLAATFPGPLGICYFVNSGSEANDLALRMARAHTGGTEFVVLGGAYHGHLSSLIDVSPYKSRGPGGSGPPSHVHELPAPDLYRGRYAEEDDPSWAFVQEAESVLRGIRTSGGRVAAFIAESALSCAGQIMLPDGYLSALYDRVRAEGGVCIADEVQVGLGRIGTHFWAFESQNVVPDIVTIGKPVGNGHPLGVVVTTPEIAESFANGMEYFNTFGGNPVSCAAGLAVLDVLRDEDLQSRALHTGHFLMSGLRAVQAGHSAVGDVRGSGLFVGVEIVVPGSRVPDGRAAGYIVERLKDSGILLSTDGPDHNVIKIKPPMVFDDDNASLLADRLGEVLRESFVTRRR